MTADSSQKKVLIINIFLKGICQRCISYFSVRLFRKVVVGVMLWILNQRHTIKNQCIIAFYRYICVTDSSVRDSPPGYQAVVFTNEYS